MTRQRKREMMPLGEGRARGRSRILGLGARDVGSAPSILSVPPSRGCGGGAFFQGREWTRLRSYFCCGQYDHGDIATWLSPREARRA